VSLLVDKIDKDEQEEDDYDDVDLLSIVEKDKEKKNSTIAVKADIH